MGVEITSEKSVKLLGINIDEKLKFKQHINELCKKAGTQLNALRQLSKPLDTKAKSPFLGHLFSQKL